MSKEFFDPFAIGGKQGPKIDQVPAEVAIGGGRVGDNLPPIARILSSNDGGPVRRIVNGRRNVYTGFFISVKGKFLQMPWESRKAEKTAMILAEASTRVVSLLAQPHRMELNIKEKKKPLVYFPDLKLKVHPSFIDDLANGMSFSEACVANSYDERDDQARTLIIEMKDERDRRQNFPRYRRKIEMAKEVYEMLGVTYIVIQRDEHIFPFELRIASSVVAWRHTSVDQFDIWAVHEVLTRGERSAGEVVSALGGGPFAWGKLRALHVRRIIEIDLTEPVSLESRVRLLLNSTAQVCVRS